LHRNYLSDLENGRRNPSLDVLVRLANALNISLEFLLKGVFSPNDF
ncbi:MAG: helix-turn-helix transcriptional regulator, partial [Bacilli bacterium]|nr:helix-turn-helix transcriptional regulator [Bacilli bacterium]